MAGYDNIKDKGFDKRTTEERRELAIKAGKASGEARRRKADFRRTLNQLLTAQIDSPEWTPILEALGLDSTLESAINAAMIKEALSGNVKAYEAIAKYSGQTDKTEADQEEQQVRMAVAKAKVPDDEDEGAEDDGFIDALNASAGEDWEDEED
ncbi:MAG: hypothetical protein J6J86_01365 [Lachnospiraceae bacterium]|nr:hypothetical protein [Lachnospiraceae bacterium]